MRIPYTLVNYKQARHNQACRALGVPLTTKIYNAIVPLTGMLTDADIKNAVRDDPMHCVAANMATRITGEKSWVMKSYAHIVSYWGDEVVILRYAIPNKTEHNINVFDETGKWPNKDRLITFRPYVRGQGISGREYSEEGKESLRHKNPTQHTDSYSRLLHVHQS